MDRTFDKALCMRYLCKSIQCMHGHNARRTSINVCFVEEHTNASRAFDAYQQWFLLLRPEHHMTNYQRWCQPWNRYESLQPYTTLVALFFQYFYRSLFFNDESRWGHRCIIWSAAQNNPHEFSTPWIDTGTISSDWQKACCIGSQFTFPTHTGINLSKATRSTCNLFVLAWFTCVAISKQRTFWMQKSALTECPSWTLAYLYSIGSR